MDILAQSSLLVSVMSFSLGFTALTRNVKNKLFLAFSGLTTVIGGWAGFFFLESVLGGGYFYRAHLLLNIWVGPVALAFIRVLTRIEDRFTETILTVSVILGLVLSGALGLNLDSTPWGLQVIYYAPVVVVIQIFRLMLIDIQTKRGIHRHPKKPTVGLDRRNLIYAGALLVLGTSVLDHVPWMGRVVPSVGNLALSVYLFFLSRAITQQRLLNFYALFSRFLVLLGIALLLSSIYSLLMVWIPDSAGLFFLNSFIVSFLLVSLLDPLARLMSYVTHRLLTQEHQRLELAIREAQRKLAGIVDRWTLSQSVLQTSEQLLQAEGVALFLLRSDGTRFRRVRSVGKFLEVGAPGSGLGEILANHPLMTYCAELRKKGELPILFDQLLENEIDRSASRSQRARFTALVEGLRALSANLLIPMFDAGKVLGFVAFHAPQPPEPWGSNWSVLPIIYPYYEQVGQTFRNMEVFVRQREKERLAALGEMAAGLAHEIRNPLGAIKGAAQLLDPSSDRPESQFLKVIVEEVDRLNRVVTQFLDYSRAPASMDDFKTEDLSSLVEKSVELLRPTLRAGIRLEFARPARPLLARIADGQIQQVLLNLIQNSIKALEGRKDGLIRVEIEPYSRGLEGKELAISVEDNGPGIKREHLDKLFIPFFTTSPSGTGLGLSISQKIVEAHQGRVEVTTEEGRFARFSVILPAVKE